MRVTINSMSVIGCRLGIGLEKIGFFLLSLLHIHFQLEIKMTFTDIIECTIVNMKRFDYISERLLVFFIGL